MLFQFLKFLHMENAPHPPPRPPLTLAVCLEHQDCYSANYTVTVPEAEIPAQNCNFKSKKGNGQTPDEVV